MAVFEKNNHSPELFARNMKTLFNEFRTKGFSQNDLASYLRVDPGKISRYMTGVTCSLDEDLYADIAQYMVEKICINADRTQRLSSLAFLKDFDYRELKGDSELIKNSCKQLEYAMKDIDLSMPPADRELTDDSNALSENICHHRVYAANDFASAEPPPDDKKLVKGRSHVIRLKRRNVVIGLSAVAALVILALVIENLLPPKVTLTITKYSDVGEKDAFVTGKIAVSRGNPSEYAVTMALVSPENGHLYAPKPSRANPSVQVTLTENRRIGNFTCVFASGDSPDIYARALHIYVVPASFTPTEDTGETLKNSVAYQEVNRD